MKITYDRNHQDVNFGNKYIHDTIHFQRGSLNQNPRNGLLDTEVITGLLKYLTQMLDESRTTPSFQYYLEAYHDLFSARALLAHRRFESNKRQK